MKPKAPAQLRRAEARYQRALARAQEARDARDAAIRAAIASGMSGQQISDATGLSRGRISQIKDTRSNEP